MGLKVASTILCWNLYTIHKAMIKQRLGSAPNEIVDEVKGRLKTLLGF